MAAKMGSVHISTPHCQKVGVRTPAPHRIAATGKKRGAEVAEIEKLKASRGNGEKVPPAKVRRSVVNSSPSWAPAEDSFAAFPA